MNRARKKREEGETEERKNLNYFPQRLSLCALSLLVLGSAWSINEPNGVGLPDRNPPIFCSVSYSWDFGRGPKKASGLGWGQH